jgi:hypothetical protein
MTEAATSRLADLVRFYEILSDLESKLGPARRLADCSGRIGWPKRGVYFFFESGETRSDTGSGHPCSTLVQSSDDTLCKYLCDPI